MDLSKSWHKENIRLLLLLGIWLMKSFHNLGFKPLEQFVAISSNPLDSHEVDKGNVFCFILLLLLKNLVNFCEDRRHQWQVLAPIAHFFAEAQHKRASHSKWRKEYLLSSGYCEKKVRGSVRWNYRKVSIRSSTSVSSSCCWSNDSNSSRSELTLKRRDLVWLII